MKMELFSFSRLSLFATCPRRFAYKYIEGLDDPPGPPAVFGKTVHKAIELCLHGYSFKDSVTIALLEKGDSTVDRATMKSMVKTALSYGLRGPTEQHFVLPLAAGIKLQGYIDFEGLSAPPPLIVDWKTGYKTYQVLDTWQLPLYAAAVMKKTGERTVKGVLAFLRFRRTQHAQITKEKASLAVSWAIQMAEEIQQRLDFLAVLEPHEAFPYRASPACGNCPWSLLCLREEK
ncbi:PD-(D/E)XK nuclease superfamily protein [Peptococcaceae bacterium CEB3]|nr:PD-(D/E)XK nuclease superfamily protein [Peptococcaceae bacterium CEB3]